MVSQSSAPQARTDGILRASSYQRKDYDMAVIWFPPREHASISESISSTFREPANPLGDLERLPLELINTICLDLDIKSLFALRHVNLRARQIVTSLREYQIATSYALNCMCALLRTNAATFVSLADVHRVLCESLCSHCGEAYGDLVHLLNWTRCCSACLRQRTPGTRTTTLASAKRILRLPKASAGKLRRLRSLPGIYSMEETTRKACIDLVLAGDALLLCQEEEHATELSLDSLGKQPCFDFMACCALPYYDAETHNAQYGVSCAGCQLAVEDDTNRDEEACTTRDMVYSHETYIKHFQECRYAQLLWESSHNGTIEPPNLPYGCKRGGYFNPRS